MHTRKFAVIGGDKRNHALADMLAKDGHDVKFFGFKNYDSDIKNLSDAIKNADFIIGPTPCSHAGGVLVAPFHNEPILADDLFNHMTNSQIFLAGYIKPDVLELAKVHDVRVIDMLKREELLVKNAIPTAEGAIKIAIEETEITLHGSQMLIIGYGRIGKILSQMLRGLGAKVVTVVNNSAAEAAAFSQGCEVCMFEDIERVLPQSDIIFNTVPETVLDKTNMGAIRAESTLIIDLASPPYGVDVNDSREFGLRVLYAGSLPGKIAPLTTAGYIRDTIEQIIQEMGAES